MKTCGIKFHRYEYLKVPNRFKYSEYSLKSEDLILPKTIRIEENRKFNYGFNFKDFLRLMDHKKVKDCNVKTGLRAIHKENCFYGDLIQRDQNNDRIKSFILVQFINNRQILIIDYFRGFTPHNAVFKQMLLTEHKFKYQEQTISKKGISK